MMPPDKDSGIPYMPVCHRVGLHEQRAASADVAAVAPAPVRGEKAWHSPCFAGGASYCSRVGSFAKKEAQLPWWQHCT